MSKEQVKVIAVMAVLLIVFTFLVLLLGTANKRKLNIKQRLRLAFTTEEDGYNYGVSVVVSVIASVIASVLTAVVIGS